MVASEVDIPTRDALLWPTIKALRGLGGSGAVSEINERVVELEAYSPAQQAVLHGAGPQTKIEYRLAWARTNLRIMELAENSARGVWTLTELGRSIGEADVPKLHSEARRAMQAERARRRKDEQFAGALPGSEQVEAECADGTDDGSDWKEILLEAVMAMPSDAFERLAQRLLREAGFISVNVTGGSGDGGIDGLGVYRLSLVSFPVFFQCKRYRGSVAPSAVRDFRGAMAVSRRQGSPDHNGNIHLGGEEGSDSGRRSAYRPH